LTIAKVLAAGGDDKQSLGYLRDVLAVEKKKPGLASARAMLQWGDLVAAGAERDYEQAIKHHMQAIKLATPLARTSKMVPRREAPQVLTDAHLGVARDIAWGRWQQKSRVVPKWLDKALTLANQSIADDRTPEDLRFHVSAGALAALAGIHDPPDAQSWIRSLR